MLLNQCLSLKEWGASFDAERFRLSVRCDNRSVVVAKHDHQFSLQVGPKQLFAAGVHRIYIAEQEHINLCPAYELRA